MLKVNKEVVSDSLVEQFGLKNEDNLKEIYENYQEELTNRIVEKVKADMESGEEDFDAKELLEYTFNVFNNQELQDSILLQYVMKDIQDRVRFIIMEMEL